MRALLLLFPLVVMGCGKGSASDTSVKPRPNVDRTAELRERDAQAAFSLDAASSSLAEALEAARKLAPTAGGDAKDALLDVAEMLDSAGATLSDFDDPPPALAEYRTGGPARTTERGKALAAALDALRELRDAQGTLDDLTGNAPAEHREALAEISDKTDEAIDSVEGAIRELGGKVPEESN